MVTGLDDLDTEISIYPNPFIDYVRIANPEGKLDFIKVFDTQGVLLQEFFDIKQQFTELHVSNSPDGIYLLKIQKGQKTNTRKIIKNRTK